MTEAPSQSLRDCSRSPESGWADPVLCSTCPSRPILGDLRRVLAAERPTLAPLVLNLVIAEGSDYADDNEPVFERLLTLNRLPRPVRMPCEHSATRSGTNVSYKNQPIWILRSTSRKSPGGATVLYVIPVDSSRSCSLLVVKNHHRDRSSQHHPRARVAESACHLSLSVCRFSRVQSFQSSDRALAPVWLRNRGNHQSISRGTAKTDDSPVTI
jgi:hypothetical protein